MRGKSVSVVAARIGALGMAAVMAALTGRSGADALSEAAAFTAASYGLSLLLFAGFPRLRRDDLALAAGAGFVALALPRYLEGSTSALAPLLFGLAGAGGAWAPSRVERFRSEERSLERRRGGRASDLVSGRGQTLPAAAKTSVG